MLGEKIKWLMMLLALCIAGVFYLNSNHEWIQVQRAMSDNEPSADFPNDLSLLSLDGENINLESYYGEEMFVFFFTTWCHICTEQWSELDKAKDELTEKGIQVIAINLTTEEQNDQSVKSYVEKLNSTESLIVLDKTGEARKQFRVIGIPTSLFINNHGEIVTRTEGLLTAEKLIQTIKGDK